MSENSLGSTIIKYEKALSEKPTSLVFAPLSQAYCEMGLFDKAMSVLKKGIRYNPSYVLGYVALAGCYYGQEEYHLAFSTLRPLVAQNRDNIKLQLLFAKVTEKTEDFEESLDTYRYLNFLNPQDEFFLERITWLESKMRQNEVNYSKDENVQFDIEDINLDSDAEEWEQVNFVEKKNLEEELAPEDQDDWTTLEASRDKDLVTNHDKDNTLFTHTLVDLYLRQGHIEKAREILEKILEIRPGDTQTLKKLENLPIIHTDQDKTEKQGDHSFSEGHDDLMASFDKLDENKSPKKTLGLELNKAVVSDYSETLDPLHDFRDALLAKGRDKSINRK